MCPVLPVKISPHINESCYGFVMRIAAANAYPSTGWIADLEPCLRHPQYSKDTGHIEKIANALNRLIGLSEQESKFLDRSLLIRHHISAVHYSFRVRICPECLKKNKHMDYMWEIAFASVCPFHGILLIDSCCECSLSIDRYRAYQEFCTCGADLTESQTTMADARQLYYNTKMWLAMGRKVPDIMLPDIKDEMLNQFDLNSLCNFYQLMLRVVLKKTPGQNSKPNWVSDAVEVFEIIHPVLSEWPLGLYRYLDSYRNNNGEFKGEGLKQAFGEFYRVLNKRDDFQFKFIEEAFEAYVRSNWTGVIDGKYRRKSSQLKCDYALISDAVKNLNVGRARMNKLMDLGVISCTRKLRPSGRHYTLIKRCEIMRFAKISKHMINKKETCRVLGISKKEFDVLVAHKVINPIVKAGDRKFSEWWCDSRKIKVYLEKILVTVPKQKPGDDAVSYTKVCQAHLTNINLLPELLQSVITGQVQVAGMNLDESDGEFRLSSLYFNPSEIALFRQDFKKKNSSAYSLPEAARMMELKQQVVYHLVNKGFLNCHEDPTGFQRGRVVSFDDIVEFEERYIPLAEIARSRNHCPRSLMRTFVRLGISPAIGGGTDDCRQVFYRRSEIPESYQDW